MKVDSKINIVGEKGGAVEQQVLSSTNTSQSMDILHLVAGELLWFYIHSTCFSPLEMDQDRLVSSIQKSGEKC